MKRLLFLLAFSLLAEFCMAEYFVLPFVSYSADFANEDSSGEFKDIGSAGGLGLGISIPLLFGKKLVKAAAGTGGWFDDDIYSYFAITPTVAVDWTFIFSNLLRIRAGASFGKFRMEIMSFGYYAGVSGAFMKDFANDAITFGISPTISVELYAFLLGMRVQAQYDFYTIERYNRFVVTVSLMYIVFGDGF